MIEIPDEPLEPHGWFRWLHHASAGRISAPSGLEVNSSIDRDWESADAKFVARHAWEAGRREQLELLDAFWDRLPPTQRGRAAAGLSLSENYWVWISPRLPGCELDAASTCELACNAIRWRKDGILAAVLEASSDLTGDVPRYDGPVRKTGRFSEEISRLSCRCVDLVLEAALIRRNIHAAGLALEHGANPDAPIWVLERSFNEKHCPLSYCRGNDLIPAAELLLAAGANPAGTDFCIPNLPLYMAVSDGKTDFALKLLERGATFASLDPGGQRVKRIRAVRKERPRWISPAADYFFGHSDEDLKWVRQNIGELIPLVPVEAKQCFYDGNGQGGSWGTFLTATGGSVELFKLYRARGLDTRLSAEELLTLFKANSFDVLQELLSAEPARGEVFSRMRRWNPAFGKQAPMTATLTVPNQSHAPGAVFISLNASKHTPSPQGPGDDSPKEKSGDDRPDIHPFDAFWLGFYAGPVGTAQIDDCDCIGWNDEFTNWVRDHGLFHFELYPHRFIIGKIDPETRKRIDLSRREFFQIQKQFEFLTAKYGLCLSGVLTYSRQLSGKPLESYPECYHMNHVRSGDSIGRPFHHEPPEGSRRKMRLL